MEESFVILVFEYFERVVEFSVHLLIDPLHHHEGDVFVCDAFDESVFEYM